MTGCFEVLIHDFTAGAMKSHSKAGSVVADRVSLGGDD